MAEFKILTSAAVQLLRDDIDTDQIIPARFLKTTNKAGLGADLFSDWRYNADGQPKPDFIINDPKSQGRQVLFTGSNFGCGSSREHAPWALTGWGFRAVIARSFADIFRNNSLKNGLLPVALTPADHDALAAALTADPDQPVVVDLADQQVRWNGGSAAFEVDPFSRTCLLQGIDELGYLLSFKDQVEAFEAAR